MLQYAYLKAGGDGMEQLRRAEMAPDEVARECEAGKLGACQGLRGAHGGGASRLPEDRVKAAYFGAKANWLIEQQCQTGAPDACMSLAQNLLSSPPQDVARGRRLADEACARGGYLDCWMLGEHYHYGEIRDPATAETYFAKAVAAAKPVCEAGNAGACEMLGRAYVRGRGAPRDERKFVEYTGKAMALTRDK